MFTSQPRAADLVSVASSVVQTDSILFFRKFEDFKVRLSLFALFAALLHCSVATYYHGSLSLKCVCVYIYVRGCLRSCCVASVSSKKDNWFPVQTASTSKQGRFIEATATDFYNGTAIVETVAYLYKPFDALVRSVEATEMAQAHSFAPFSHST